nr:MAG TPA: hypothetical protein [Caudoviricetes sp.]
MICGKPVENSEIQVCFIYYIKNFFRSNLYTI